MLICDCLSKRKKKIIYPVRFVCTRTSYHFDSEFLLYFGSFSLIPLIHYSISELVRLCTTPFNLWFACLEAPHVAPISLHLPPEQWPVGLQPATMHGSLNRSSIAVPVNYTWHVVAWINSAHACKLASASAGLQSCTASQF